MSLLPRIVVIGSANTDMVIKTERIPHPGETVIGGEFVMAAGGKGANQAVAAARLGAHVVFVACLGADLFGDQAIAGYEREGIDTSYVVRDEAAASGIAMIFVDSRGENSIAVASGANARLGVREVECARDVITQADVVLAQLEIPLPAVRRALELARESGVLTILNPAPGQRLDSDLLEMVSILTPNEGELQMITGIGDREVALAHLLHAGVGAVLLTLGSAGALWSSYQTTKVIPSFQVSAVDTTAAGDAFNGGLAVALGQGSSMEAAIRYANAVAAISVTRMGAQPSLPSKNEVSAFLTERFG